MIHIVPQEYDKVISIKSNNRNFVQDDLCISIYTSLKYKHKVVHHNV